MVSIPTNICYLWIQLYLVFTGRVGRYFDILIYRDIFNRDYRIEGRNLGDDISKYGGRYMLNEKLGGRYMLNDYCDIASHVHIAVIKS